MLLFNVFESALSVLFEDASKDEDGPCATFAFLPIVEIILRSVHCPVNRFRHFLLHTLALDLFQVL